MKKSELKQIIREEIEKELSSKPEGMKVEKLKLYNKYKNINYPDIEFIYIGIDKHKNYCFLFKTNKNLLFSILKSYGFDPDKIVTDLNLETFIKRGGDKCIKGYWVFYFSKEDIEYGLKSI
jgi:hypothetical protein